MVCQIRDYAWTTAITPKKYQERWIIAYVLHMFSVLPKLHRNICLLGYSQIIQTKQLHVSTNHFLSIQLGKSGFSVPWREVLFYILFPSFIVSFAFASLRQWQDYWRKENVAISIRLGILSTTLRVVVNWPGKVL